MKTNEMIIKEMAIQQYGSVKSFTSQIGLSNSTFVSILRRGFNNANITNIKKICDGLNLLFCKRCGARYGIYQSGKYKYYACYSRRKRDAAMIIDPNCKNKTYNMNKLDEAILNEIRKLQADPEYFYQIKSDKQKETEAAEKIRIINAELEKIDIQISRFLDLYGLGTFTAEQLQGKIEPLKEQKNRLTAEAGSLAKHQPELTIPEAAALISSFSEIIDRGNYDEIRAIIEALIEKIEIDGDEINIFWKF